MMDYIKSEYYRLVRKKELYLTISITLGLVVAAIGALYFSLRADANFIYGTNRFLYLNVLTVWPLIILVGLLVNRQLLGNDQVIIKQSVSFGVSRSKIFFTKLCLTLLTFLFLCFIGLLLVLIAGEGLLKTETIWKTQFLIAVFNAIPLVVSGFIFGHTLVILLRNEAISVCITLFIFSSVPSKIIKLLEQEILKKELVSGFLPGTLFEQNTNKFLVRQAAIMPINWLVGMSIILTSLGVGLALYSKKDI